jgi:hypothetical protein
VHDLKPSTPEGPIGATMAAVPQAKGLDDVAGCRTLAHSSTVTRRRSTVWPRSSASCRIESRVMRFEVAVRT